MPAAIFHLMTHAFFKALLFLAAGSVIIAHAPRAGHAQDGRPAQVHADHILDVLIGALALVGLPVLRRLLLEGRDHRGRARDRTAARARAYAYWCVLLGVFVTAFYSFRLMYMTFHGKERFRRRHDDHGARRDPRARRPHGHDAHGTMTMPRPRRTPHEARGSSRCR